MRNMFQFSDSVSTTTNLAILDAQGFYGLGLRQVIQKFSGFEQSELSVFKSSKEFLESPLSVFRIVIVEAGFLEQESAHFIDQIRKENKQVIMMLLAEHDDETAVATASKHHFNAFLYKDCNSEELQFAFERLNQGEKYYNTEAMLKYMRGSSKKRLMPSNLESQLDETDIKMIHLIADEYTQVEMNKMLGLPTSTIMYLRRRLFARLGVSNTAGLIRKALQYGIIE